MAYREELEPLQGALGEALGAVARRGSPAALQTIWAQAAGAAASSASRPSGLSGGALSVEVDTPAWLHALQTQHAELCTRLARTLPGFATLELRLRWGGR